MTTMNSLYTDSNTITYLFNYALDHGISFETTYDLHKDTPSCSVPSKRKMVINLNTDEEELPFQISHEIGHILNKDFGKQFFCGESSSSPVEVKASKTGIKILADYYFYDVPKEDWNIDNFMFYYCIPSSFKDWVINYLAAK